MLWSLEIPTSHLTKYQYVCESALHKRRKHLFFALWKRRTGRRRKGWNIFHLSLAPQPSVSPRLFNSARVRRKRGGNPSSKGEYCTTTKGKRERQKSRPEAEKWVIARKKCFLRLLLFEHLCFYLFSWLFFRTRDVTKRNSREKDAAAAVISHLSSGDSSRLKAKEPAKERDMGNAEF